MNVFDVWYVVPSRLYSNVHSPVAVTVIVPSSLPHVASVVLTVVIVGSIGLPIVTTFVPVAQVPLALNLTRHV